MRTSKKLILPLTLAVALGAAGTAAAAPNQSGTLSATSTSFKWTGQIGAGVTSFTTFHDVYPCNMPLHTCDFTLLNVTTPGKVTVKTSAPGQPTTVDIDLWVYASDASGKKGKQKGMSAKSSPDPNEQFAFTADTPGYYLAEAEYDIVVGGSYTGEATLAPGEGIEATNVAPTVKISSPKKSAKSSKLKSISGTAADDTTVSKVEIAIVSGKGSSCKNLNSSGNMAKGSCTSPKFLKAKGTKKWSYKLKKKLKKGSYVILAKASDDAGGSSTARSTLKVT